MITFFILLLTFLIINKMLLNPSPSDTPAGAIVMACGIFINGAMKNIKFLEKNFSSLSAMLLLLLWIFIWFSFLKSFLNGTYKELHLKNPIKSFAIGTWVAGTSVTGIAVFQRFQQFKFIAYFLFFLNIAIWVFYLGALIRGYNAIFKNKLQNKVNGVLLISTVSTQSIVVLAGTIFDSSHLILESRAFIFLGILFYIFAFVLIIKRYLFNIWNIEDDWYNTNCILHGAMSITGLASVVSTAISGKMILIIWLWVLVWFVIVETIEITRALKRVKKYGFIKGIAVYDVTQWSRIFTFGMLYTFTMRFNLKSAGVSNELLFNIKSFILQSGTWVMVIILLIEGILFFTYERKNSTYTSK